MATATVIKPRNPHALTGIGAAQPTWLAGLIGIDFWHPDLPEVSVAHAHRSSGFLPRLWSMTREGMKPVVAALLLALLPAALQAQEPCKVNVNYASPAQLALLIQTGPVLAAKIEAARKDPKTGATVVLDIAKLDAVSGVGVKWLEYNGPHVAYDGPTTCETKLRKPATAKPEADKDGAQ